MDIEFDPDKDAASVAKHGLSLSASIEFEMAAAVVELDERFDYGEVRWRAFGRVLGEGRCLAFAYRADKLRVISFRRAHDKELRRYGL